MRTQQPSITSNRPARAALKSASMKSPFAQSATTEKATATQSNICAGGQDTFGATAQMTMSQEFSMPHKAVIQADAQREATGRFLARIGL